MSFRVYGERPVRECVAEKHSWRLTGWRIGFYAFFCEHCWADSAWVPKLWLRK